MKTKSTGHLFSQKKKRLFVLEFVFILRQCQLHFSGVSQETIKFCFLFFLFVKIPLFDPHNVV